MNYKLKKISGDASFREFYRLQKGKNTSIIIQAKKEKFKIMHYDLYRLKNKKELNTLGIFQDNENAIKIIGWPSLLKIPISDKLEIHLDYAKHDNERKLRLLGTGKWKNFK